MGLRQHHKTRGRRRVLIIDDHPQTLGHVVRLLERDFTVAGVIASADTVLEDCAALRPDVVLLDIYMPGRSGLDAAQQLRAAKWQVPIVFFSVDETPELIQAAWTAGGLGYVAKCDTDADLLPVIHGVLAGRRMVSNGIASYQG